MPTRRRALARISLAGCIGAFALLAACAPSRRSGADDDDGNGDGGSNCAANTCTSDLHGVQDCHGTVVQTCDPSQGCADGTCVDACAAAAANKSSIGCEYYSVDPDVIDEGTGDCFAAFVANTWGAPITISVDLDGNALTLANFARIPSGAGQNITYTPLTGGMLQPNQVAILFFADGGGVACPSGITPAIAGDGAVHGTTYGHAFHITTSAPAVAYDIFPYGGGEAALTSATLLLPTSAWDTNYVAVDPYEMSEIAGQPFTEIVGSVDGTTVTITPTAAIGGGTGIAATGAGIPAQYALAAGQVLQFTQNAELIGSVISSNQPIGVWGGASCMNIPIDLNACDAAHQQLPPVKALGNHYAAVRYRNRFVGQEETVPWRIVGAVDGTTLTYSPATPPNAPTVINQGDVKEFDSPGQFVVESQGSANPFYMGAYMTGWEDVNSNGDDNRGDPEWVNVIPPEQYLAQYTFFTDPTYPETNLVLTREKVNGAFADVVVDCAGTVTGWTPLDANDDMEYTRIDLVTGNFQPVGTCNNGLHTASSAQPFGLVVWAWGSAASEPFFSQAVSYAYPAGASVKPINQVVIE